MYPKGENVKKTQKKRKNIKKTLDGLCEYGTGYSMDSNNGQFTLDLNQKEE